METFNPKNSQLEPFLTRISERLADLRFEDSELRRDSSLPKIIEPAANYFNLESALTISSEEGITLFAGGPLDLKRFGIDSAWVSPVEVADEHGSTTFHLLMLNFNPKTQPADIKVKFNMASELSLKLDDFDSKPCREVLDAIYHNDGLPQIIVRPSLNGNIAFPLMSTPLNIPEPDVLKERTNRLKANIPILAEMDLESTDFDSITDRNFEMLAEHEHFVLGEPKLIKSPSGLVYVYDVLTTDQWEHYQLIMTEPLNELRKRETQVVRLDSGCDSGMLYRDGGCDCHQQLLSGISEIREKGGLIVHCPTQDGRGYGMVTKMETEAWKQGAEGVLNEGEPPVDTVTAAQKVFEGEYDIRTYESIAEILAEIGIRKINLLTDNVHKFEAIASHHQMQVNRIPTNTENNPANSDCKIHIEAKLNNSKYFGK